MHWSERPVVGTPAEPEQPEQAHVLDVDYSIGVQVAGQVGAGFEPVAGKAGKVLQRDEARRALRPVAADKQVAAACGLCGDFFDKTG